MSIGWLAAKLSLTVSVASLPIASTGLDPLLVVSSDTTFDGTERYRAYTSASEIQADLTATEISATAAAQATAALGGVLRPGSVIIGRRNGSGSETWGAALTAIRAAGAAFSYVVADTRTIADQVTIGTWCDGEGDVMFVAQSEDSSWLDSGVPSGATPKASLVWLYHPTSGQYADAAYAGSLSAINPNQRAIPGRLRIVGPTTYGATLAQINAADANYCNLIRPLVTNRPQDGVGVWSGWTSTGDTVGLLTSRIWLVREIYRRTRNVVAAHWSAGTRLAGVSGANEISSVFSDLGALGVAAGHWSPSLALPDGFAITVALDETGSIAQIAARYHVNDEIREIDAAIYLERGV